MKKTITLIFFYIIVAYTGVLANKPDSVYWGRQSYPVVLPGGNCLVPEIDYDMESDLYTVGWKNNKPGQDEYYAVTTKDFKEYTHALKIFSLYSHRQMAVIGGNTAKNIRNPIILIL